MEESISMTWKYNEEDFIDAPKGIEGFVYLITNLTNDRKYIEKEWTKFDAYVLMNVRNTPNITNTPQAWAGFILLRKNIETIVFISEWTTFVQDPRIITDIPSKFGQNDKSFHENRHDQTILSLLCKKRNIPFHTIQKDYMINLRKPV